MSEAIFALKKTMEANTIKLIASAMSGMLAAFLAPLAPYALLCTVMVLADVVSDAVCGVRVLPRLPGGCRRAGLAGL